jgi:hypothetical protein
LRIVVLLALLGATAGVSLAQEGVESADTFAVDYRNRYRLQEVVVLPGSARLFLDGALVDSAYYRIDYATGEFRLADSLDYAADDTIVVAYRSVPVTLKREHRKRSLERRYVEALGDTARVVAAESAFGADAVFGPEMKRSGMISRGFRLGTNNDLTLQSGFRLQLEGRLAEDVSIVAALTDENTPIQPEGSTERLEELDKVFIRVEHPNAVGVFGDYDYSKRIGEFDAVERKLQGLTAETRFERANGFGAFAGSRGKFNTNRFGGIDGVQGPYRLSGTGGSEDIVVVAGSERVFLDGERLTRGEANDYTIDYATAEITFTVERLIDASSRIVAEFEYADRRYARNFYGVGADAAFLEDRLRAAVVYHQEGDDKNAPIEILLSDEDKRALEEAGDDPLKAARDGAKLAPLDSTGVRDGVYVRVDTTIDGASRTIYRYDPGSEDAEYLVSFSRVGEGAGDYERVTLGNYRYVGEGAGAYAPVVRLPTPSAARMAATRVEAELFEGATLALDLAGTLNDRNLFSDLDDEDNGAYARNARFDWTIDDADAFGADLGEIALSFRERYVEARFAPLDRFRDVEFERTYDAEGGVGNETLREATAAWRPTETTNLSLGYGSLARGEDLQSDRWNARLELDEELGAADLRADAVSSERGSTTSEWLRSEGEGFAKAGVLRPGVEYLVEDRRERAAGDSLSASSHAYYEAAPYAAAEFAGGLTLALGVSRRLERSALGGELRDASLADGARFDFEYRGSRRFTTDWRFAIVDKDYYAEFESPTNLDQQTVVVRSRTSARSDDRAFEASVTYEAAAERAARMERRFVKVEEGAGNYEYLGDLDGDGVSEESEFEPTAYDGDFIMIETPTDELFPVVDLAAGGRCKIRLEPLVGATGVGAWLAPISTETRLRLEEKNKEERVEKIYFLDFSSFLDPELTMRGYQFVQQDVHLFERERDFSARFRFNQRRNLSQFYSGAEFGYRRERSVRVEFAPMREIGAKVEFVEEIDNLEGSSSANRNRRVEGTETSIDFSYRPVPEVEAGFVVAVGSSRDARPDPNVNLETNAQTLRLRASIGDAGRLRAEVERKEYLADRVDLAPAFELTDGNPFGKNYFWRVNFDHRFGANLQATIAYDGRLREGGDPIHTMRAEARAFF